MFGCRFLTWLKHKFMFYFLQIFSRWELKLTFRFRSADSSLPVSWPAAVFCHMTALPPLTPPAPVRPVNPRAVLTGIPGEHLSLLFPAPGVRTGPRPDLFPGVSLCRRNLQVGWPVELWSSFCGKVRNRSQTGFFQKRTGFKRSPAQRRHRGRNKSGVKVRISREAKTRVRHDGCFTGKAQ